MAVPIDVSASVASSAATGAVGNKTGPNFIVGGSTGISTTVIIIVLVIAGIGFLIYRKLKP